MIKITMKAYLFFTTLLIFNLLSCSSRKNENLLSSYKGIFILAPQHIPGNRTPDGPIIGNGDVGIVFGGNPNDQYFYLSKNDVWKAKNGYPNGGVCCIGALRIQSEALKNASYYAEEQIDRAQIFARFEQDKYLYLMKSWIAATENVAVIEVEGGEKPVPLSAILATTEGNGSTNESGQTDGIYWSVRKFESSDLEFQTKVAVAMKIIGADGPEFNVSKKNPVKILLGFCTNHDDEDYLQGAIDKVKDLSNQKLADLRRLHEEWWNNFWQESSVSLGDSILEKYYYGSQYLLASCSRNEEFAPGLWGNTLSLDAGNDGWAGDYHTNYNYQAPWWGVYSSNHVELSDPYDAPILEYMNRGKEHARTFLNKKGVYYPVGIGPKGFCSSMYPLTEEKMMESYHTPEVGIEGGYMFLGQKSDAVFCTTNMFMRFYHTYDRAYAEKVYPFIREVADFWEDYLVYENDRYVIYNDNFWEVGPWNGPDFKKDYGDINPTISLGLCRMLFKGIIEMSSFLGKDSDHVEKWKHILDHLSAIPTVQINGVTKIKVCEGGTGSGSRLQPGFGRVIMHGLTFPSGVCGVVTDSAFAKILCDEIYRWNTDTINPSVERDATWDDLSNGIETYFTSAARLGYDGDKLLVKLKNRIFKTAYPNLWIPQTGGGIESLSAVPSCINEMLLQGYEGKVRIFPVWPKTKDASFRNLRTHGAFVVSSACKNGQVEFVDIKSEKGRKCIIENPFYPALLSLESNRKGKVELSGRICEIATEEGEMLHITKSPNSK